ncbi:aminotransferase class I/II-fold pyridoxal phosphate-dependent enzyme [Actinoallomurus spadix]|uniref:Aminotransferase class I/II-fold pyridoxal phosphate-dependent enzyme n=1 Tax=Actinoallomurus spadix TaxID=79912 RepID=A0ABN0W1F1_9ACTN|nr:aminotransferase class I/II-fold pyridoxal phosphate-dependent enzyme [Actinoallomurus spadix]MCO5985362.1 aminotransferase class I/II-fold pyridoxal phosphate-dependent enzyme [Actinoallomurus spadix]
MKTALRDLALFGGPVVFAEPLHVGRPNIPDRDGLMKRVAEALDRGRLTNFGPLVREFEARVAEVAGTRHCVAVCNATVGLQVLICAAGLRGEVIVPSFTYVATPHALWWEGVTPIFCDIDPETGNLDPAQVARLITDRTTGILGVHVWGRPCAVDELRALADEHDLQLLYDSAHAIGCGKAGRPVGSFGRAEVFSFHATKFVNAFEGGAIVTDDDALAARVRSVHYFGFDDGGDVVSVGTNAKMNEISAAMGLTSLDHLPGLLARNRANHERYVRGLAGVPGVRVREPAPDEVSNHQFVTVDVDAGTAGFDRDALAAVLRAENVLVRTHFDPCCHRRAPYRDRPEVHSPLPLPHSEALSSRVMQLPTGMSIEDHHIDQICEIVRLCSTLGPAVSVKGSLRDL